MNDSKFEMTYNSTLDLDRPIISIEDLREPVFGLSFILITFDLH